MRIRESGMPDRDTWEGFFDPVSILHALALDPASRIVVDIGCGYGTFALAAAEITGGTVYALDLDPPFLDVCRRRVSDAQAGRILCQQRDVLRCGTGLPDGAADYVMLFNVLHTAQPVLLLREVYRTLTPGGKVGVLHWNYDPETPRGPPMSMRPRPEQCEQWLSESGFELVGARIDLPPYHYGLVGRKLAR
jgi:SAM-dependent methyltransferase